MLSRCYRMRWSLSATGMASWMCCCLIIWQLGCMMMCRVDLEGEGQGQVNAQDSTVEEVGRLEEVEETVLLEVLSLSY